MRVKLGVCLRLFESRVPRRIFGQKRGEVPLEWRKLHNQEFHELCSSPSTISLCGVHPVALTKIRYKPIILVYTMYIYTYNPQIIKGIKTHLLECIHVF
jgi:hypothetical protein